MNRVADRGHENLSIQTIVLVNLSNLTNQTHAVRRYIVQSADKGANQGRSRLCDQQCLQRRRAARTGTGVEIGEHERERVEELMGRRPELRFRFIQERAAFAENLDI